jgi:TolA-binding protein
MKFFTALFFALIVAVTGVAQTSSKPASPSADLIAATERSKAAAEEQVPVAEEAVKKATDSLKLIERLVSEGLVAQVEVERAQEELNCTEARVKELQKQISDSIHVVADLKKAELAQAEASRIKQFTKPTLMAINTSGSVTRATDGNWSMANLSAVQQFFASTFGRALPISTVGQSATHNRLGWDHRNAVDVGVHPDSKEGQALIGFLQSSNIPFLAFRSAIPGVATGPHIHIGSPSHRQG